MDNVKCARCGRPLSNKDSLVAGVGPTCATKLSKSDSGVLLGDAPVLNDVPPLLQHGLVLRRLEDGRLATNVPHLLVYHSPTGFDCGYGGSGPAELALNVLHVLLPPKLEHDFGDGRRLMSGHLVSGTGVSPDALRLHQDFKWDFIAKLPKDGGFIPLEAIQGWIASRITEAEAA